MDPSLPRETDVIICSLILGEGDMATQNQTAVTTSSVELAMEEMKPLKTSVSDGNVQITDAQHDQQTQAKQSLG